MNISPDCRDGKCAACVGDAWDETADAPAACACDCHYTEQALTNIGAVVAEAVRVNMHDSARSAQSRQRLIGPSEVGACRSYLARMIADVPFDESAATDMKWAAFIGTAVGERIENQLVDLYPDRFANQVPVTATLTLVDGTQIQISGNVDLVEHGVGVHDVKTKDGTRLVAKQGPTFEHLAQVNIYLAGAIAAGLVPPDGTWSLVYTDRSGRDDVPVVFTGRLDHDHHGQPGVMNRIASRLADVFYAVEYDLDSAPRDKPYDYCSAWCPFFSSCRGADEHQVSGLITSEEHLQAVDAYQQGLALSREGEKLKDEAKQVLSGISGSTGEWEISWTFVPATEMKPSVRAAYNRMSLRKVKAPAAAKGTSR